VEGCVHAAMMDVSSTPTRHVTPHNSTRGEVAAFYGTVVVPLRGLAGITLV